MSNPANPGLEPPVATEPSTPKGRRPPKRERLIAAAVDQVHRFGYAGTSLARIADEAEVPIGNVYYYFKTKDDLLRAVLDQSISAVDAMLAAAGTEATPTARIVAFIDALRQSSATIATRGCALGCLHQDLARLEGELRSEAGTVFGQQLDWLERQFADAGHDEPRALAVHTLARSQGAATMCRSLGDPAALETELDRLEEWVEGLGSAADGDGAATGRATVPGPAAV